MITESLRHCHGVGPVKLAQLHSLGIRSWHDAVESDGLIPRGIRTEVVAESRRSIDALERDDIDYFCTRLCPEDKWRILSQYFDQTSFFDIETNGLEYDACVTVIACWHRGQLHTFVEHENLDDFLDLLDDVSLLASFNGASFDVPRVLDAFHIPNLPCPHLDLRWPCYHAGLPGSLKRIAADLRIERPADLTDVDGELAIHLWSDWIHRKDEAARDHLIRYCAADVLLLVFLAQHLGNVDHVELGDIWSQLPASDLPERTSGGMRPGFVPSLFGNASPTKLRMRRRIAG